MKTKNIFKALALAMLMPAMMLTTACSNEDGTLNSENTSKKGYALPVTINVTRQGDEATTRATFDNDTKKLAFSTGDKLFVSGWNGENNFAGTLTWQSGGTFSGTIYTKDPYSGTTDDLLAAADPKGAVLLPAGYETYGYLSVKGEGYGAYLSCDYSKTFALTKAAAVEQFSEERTNSYSSGFALAPVNAILNFTITGLTASTEVAVAFTKASSTISGNVTTNASGTATFAVGLLAGGTDLKDYTLTVGGNAITLVSSSTVLAAGKIYNITRSAAPAATDLSTLSGNYEAQDGETLTGTLGGNYKISVAAGATVTLDGVTINGTNDNSYKWAGITCEGGATIILSGTNTMKGFHENYPGIYVPQNKTLTIQGDGSLDASSNGKGAGIGGGYQIACGNITIAGGNVTATGGRAAGIGGGYQAMCGTITIEGGNVTATGGTNAAGIGSGQDATCGIISITGGTATAKGGYAGAGIGSGFKGVCGDITITDGVTSVTATKGSGSGSNLANSIGKGGGTSSCGTVTIGGQVTGNITESPYTYEPGK